MGSHRSRPLLVTTLRAALLLGAVGTPFVAPPAFAEDPIPPTPAQKLDALETEYRAVMDEAGQLGTGRTIDESIRFSTNRQGQTRVDLERLEEAIQRQGATVEELTAARDRFKDETIDPEEVAKAAAEKGAEKVVTKVLPKVLQRVFKVASLIGDVVEFGGKKYIKRLNIADMNALIAQGRLQKGQLLELYSVMNLQLIDEINAQRRLRELAVRRRELFEQIAEERRRQSLSPANERAILRRDTDAAGDRALEEEAARERLNNGVRLSDPADAARRKAELERGGRGVTSPMSYAPGFGAESLRFNAVLTVGYMTSDLPTSAGIGFQRPTGNPEKFASRGHSDEELMAFGLIFFADITEDWVLATAMQYAWGEDEDEGFIEDGTGIDTGFVYGDLSPGGSSGVNIGDRGLDWSSEFDVRSFNMEIKLTHRSQGPVTWFVYADALHMRRDYSTWALGEVTFSGYPSSTTYTLTQMREQEVTDTLIGAGAGLQFGAPVTPWLNVGGWTSAGTFYRRSELDSRERNVCGLCGPSDADFTLDLDDKDSGLTWALAAGVFAEVPLGDHASIGLGLDASYIDEVGMVYNPRSGDDVFVDGRHTGLTTDSLWTWGVRAGVKWRF